MNILLKYRCIYCKQDKVGVLAKWFGLHHCEGCENSMLHNQYREELINANRGKK